MNISHVLVSILSPLLVLSQDGDAPRTLELGFENILEGARSLLEQTKELNMDQPEDEPATEPLVLTAQSSVEMALRNSPGVLSAGEDVLGAWARRGQAVSAFFPTLTASVAYSFQEDAGGNFGENFITELVAPGGADVKEITRRDQFSVQQVLFAGGQRIAALRASKYLAQSEGWQRSATLDSIEFQAKQAYYDCLLAQALVQVAMHSVVTFERHRADAQQKLDVGLASRFEVLRAETELGSRQADLVESENRRRLAYANLRRILAVSQDRTLLLADAITWIPVASTPGELAARASESRPELRSLQGAIAAAQQDVKRARGQYLPRAVATAEFTNSAEAGQFIIDGWTASLGAQWDIFSGGRRQFEISEARSRVRSLEHQLAEVELLVELEVRQAYIQVQDAIAKIEREQGNVELAREGQRLAALRFQEGVGTQADVLDAELALTNSETQLVLALRDYAVAHAAVDRSVGRSWVDRVELLGEEEGLSWNLLWRR